MTMTTTFSLRYEGPPSCVDCQRIGVPVCAHIGFNPEAWDSSVGQLVHAPGLDGAYQHTLTGCQISPDRKTLTLTVATERPPMMDLARHLSTYGVPAAKAWVRAVHHDTGETLEEGHYDRPLVEGMEVCVDRDHYRVISIAHPNRNEHGVAVDGDLQVATLQAIPHDTVTVQP